MSHFSTLVRGTSSPPDSIGTSGGVMFTKLVLANLCEFESHWVPLSFDLVPHLSNKT